MLNNTEINLSDESELSIKLVRFIQGADNFAQKGGDYSLTLTLPRTKNNNNFFKKSPLSQLGKFDDKTPYTASVSVNGIPVFKGNFRLTQIKSDGFYGELQSENIEWIEELSKYELCKLLYDGEEPTWFAPYLGGSTINTNNSVNDNAVHDIVFPQILYNNTPITDYMDRTEQDVFGVFDGSGNQIQSPMDFPNSFITRPTYWSYRDGSTFEDFPPAVYYRNVIDRCFQQIGWRATGNIFQEAWFNKLVMPYVGSGYKWNYRSLGSVYIQPQLYTTSYDGITIDNAPDTEIYRSTGIVISPGITKGHYHLSNAWQNDNVAVRVDRIGNFKKFKVTDDDAGFICPEDGRYRFSVNSSYSKKLDINDAPLWDLYGDNADYDVDDNVLILLRSNQAGEQVLAPDTIERLVQWMSNMSNDFVTQPNDVIAYVSPKRCLLNGNSDINSTGSPISNFTEQVQIAVRSHTIIADSATERDSKSSVSMTVEVDLLKNERVNAYWVSLVNLRTTFNRLNTMNTEQSPDYSETFIDYLCGYTQLDIAGNLPCINLKDFISGFVNQFNLFFTVEPESKTVNFIFNDQLLTDRRTYVNIDNYVDADSIVMSPPDMPKRLVVGYDNDTNDRLLNYVKSLCEADTTLLNNYANIDERISNSPYARNELRVLSNFSSTQFIEGFYEVIQLFGTTISPFSSFNDPAENPFIQGFSFSPDSTQTLTWAIPSIQSLESFGQRTVGQLDYTWDYTPRLLYFLGTAENHFGINNGLRFKINSPDAAVVALSQFWIQPTVLAFDTENNNPYPTLRFDGINGLYDKYFFDLINEYRKTYILTVSCEMNPVLWNQLNGRRLVQFNGNQYRLLSIEDYDVSNQQMSTLTLLKLN